MDWSVLIMLSERDCVEYGCCVCKWIDKPKPCPANFSFASKQELLSRMNHEDDEKKKVYIENIINKQYGGDNE